MTARRTAIARAGETAIPTIACINRAPNSPVQNFSELVRALQTYVSVHVGPVWGTPARLTCATDYQPGAWALLFLDEPGTAATPGSHDLTPHGLPQARVFVRNTIERDERVSVAASRALVGLLTNPARNLIALGPDERSAYVYESVGPVGALSFPVHGMAMSNFVYPAWFEAFHAERAVPYDHLGRVKAPFEILPGGSQTVFAEGRWTRRFGASEPASLHDAQASFSAYSS